MALPCEGNVIGKTASNAVRPAPQLTPQREITFMNVGY